MKFFYIILFAFILFSSCKKENKCDCFKRTGDIISEIRNVESFNRIFVEQDVNVFITQDTIAEVRVEAGENIVPLIETIVLNGELIIRNKNRCNWIRGYDKPINIYIKTPGLRYIHSDGSGEIKSLNTITVDSFDVRLAGTGNIELTVKNSKVISHVFGLGDLTLHGTTWEHSCSIGGTSYLYASDLITNYSFIHSFTLGLSYIRTSGLLICRIDDKGDVYCSGNPAKIDQAITKGEGKLILQ